MSTGESTDSGMVAGSTTSGRGPACRGSTVSTARSTPARSWAVTGPRQPSVGSRNLRTSRSAKGVGLRRARRTGSADRDTSIRACGGSSTVRRPSHHSTPVSRVRVSTSTPIVERGPTTRGRVNRAWALMGTHSRASTEGHTTGPPPEKA